MDFHKNVVEFENTYNRIHKKFVSKQFEKQLDVLVNQSNFSSMKNILDEMSSNFMNNLINNYFKILEFEKQYFSDIKTWYALRIKLFLLKDNYLKTYIDSSVVYFHYFQIYHKHFMHFVSNDKDSIQNIKNQIKIEESNLINLESKIYALQNKLKSPQGKNKKYIYQTKKQAEDEILTLRNNSSIYNWIDKMFQKYSYHPHKIEKLDSHNILQYLNDLETLIDSQVEQVIGENKDTKHFFSNVSSMIRNTYQNKNKNKNSNNDSFYLSMPNSIRKNAKPATLQANDNIVFPPLQRNNKNGTAKKYLYNSPQEFHHI